MSDSKSLRDSGKFTDNDVRYDIGFRWRFYLKLSHVNTYNYFYGNPQTEHEKHYKNMVDYYTDLINDCKFYMSLKCNQMQDAEDEILHQQDEVKDEDCHDIMDDHFGDDEDH